MRTFAFLILAALGTSANVYVYATEGKALNLASAVFTGLLTIYLAIAANR